MLSLVLWSSLCTYRLSQPSVATLCSLFSPSLKEKIFLFSKFLLFYYLKKNCGDNDDAVDDNEYFIDITERERKLAHHLCQPFIFSIILFLFCLVYP